MTKSPEPGPGESRPAGQHGQSPPDPWAYYPPEGGQGAQPSGPPGQWAGPPPGQAPPGPPFGPPQPTGVSNGLGTAGLVLGVIALVLFWVPGLNLLLGVLAATFGGVGYSKARKGTATNGGAALAGLVMGIIGIVIALVFWLVFVIDTSGTGTTY